MNEEKHPSRPAYSRFQAVSRECFPLPSLLILVLSFRCIHWAAFTVMCSTHVQLLERAHGDTTLLHLSNQPHHLTTTTTTTTTITTTIHQSINRQQSSTQTILCVAATEAEKAFHTLPKERCRDAWTTHLQYWAIERAN